jgi:hypothetical protein
MQEQSDQPTYRIYLLTVWREPSQDQDTETRWRFLLADPYSERRYGFMNPEGLLTVLQQLDNAFNVENESI